MAPRKGRKGPKGRKVAPRKSAIKPKRRKRPAVKAATKPPPPPPSTGWYTDDQTGAQIAQQNAARQRGFIAATSSDVVTPPPFALVNDPNRLNEEMLKRIAAIEETIAKLPTASAGIGHNKPPEPIQSALLDANEIEEIKNEITIVKGQPAVPTQRPNEAVKAASKLREFGEKVLVGVATAGVLGAGKELWATFGDQLIDLANAIAAWIASLPGL